MDSQAEGAIASLPREVSGTAGRSSATPAPSVLDAASSSNSIQSGTHETQLHTTQKAAKYPSPAQIAPASNSDMQPPPPKRQRIHNYDRRPRLSICPSVSPDPDLVQDRDRNDNTLKGKFEAIFEKYGRDFSDVGDEINVITGEVVVDNGHILSMQDEKDPGSPSRARPRVSRLPTEVPSLSTVPRYERSITVGALDVIASIEAMARRVGTGQTPYPDDDGDDEEEGLDVYESREEGVPYRGCSVSTDSLLGSEGGDHRDDWESQRSGSPDSIFGCDAHDSSIESIYDEHTILPPQPLSASGSSNEPIVLTSELISRPAADLDILTARRTGSYGHPVPESFARASPPAFVKSNGQKKIVLNKIHVSKEYERLRQASSTTAIAPSQPHTSLAAMKKAKSSREPSTRRGEPTCKVEDASSKLTTMRDTKAILKRLPVARPSSEPRTMESDDESDDPLQ